MPLVKTIDTDTRGDRLTIVFWNRLDELQVEWKCVRRKDAIFFMFEFVFALVCVFVFVFVYVFNSYPAIRVDRQ